MTVSHLLVSRICCPGGEARRVHGGEPGRVHDAHGGHLGVGLPQQILVPEQHPALSLSGRAVHPHVAGPEALLGLQQQACGLLGLGTRVAQARFQQTRYLPQNTYSTLMPYRPCTTTKAYPC